MRLSVFQYFSIAILQYCCSVMATIQTDKEKLLELQKKMEQLKAQEKAIKTRQAQAERKARTSYKTLN